MLKPPIHFNASTEIVRRSPSNRNLFVFDIGDENSLNLAVNRVLWSVDHPSFMGVVPANGNPYGLILYNRGSAGYYRRNIAPRIEMLHDVAEKLSFIGFFGVLFTFTTDTKLFGSQTGAWLSMKENVNRVLSWARKGANGKRKRVHRVSEAVFKAMVAYYDKHPSRFVQLDARNHSVVFTNVRLPLKAYIRVSEDTEACYPAPHGVFYFSQDQLNTIALTKDQFVQLFNDELTCECDKQGFTHVSEFPDNIDDSTFAVSYATKYIQKQMNPSHTKYDQLRSITWIVCLRSVGVRMFTMSKTWRFWYHNLYGHSGLNYIKNNSNDSANLCYHFQDDFGNFNNFMRFFEVFLTFGDPPDRDIREYVGFSRDSSGGEQNEHRVKNLKIVVSEKGFSEFVHDESQDTVVLGKKTVTTRFEFSDENTHAEIVPYWFPHCKRCKVLSKCPRHSCIMSNECDHCCCSEADILESEQICFLAKEMFPDGF